MEAARTRRGRGCRRRRRRCRSRRTPSARPAPRAPRPRPERAAAAGRRPRRRPSPGPPPRRSAVGSSRSATTRSTLAGDRSGDAAGQAGDRVATGAGRVGDRPAEPGRAAQDEHGEGGRVRSVASSWPQHSIPARRPASGVLCGRKPKCAQSYCNSPFETLLSMHAAQPPPGHRRLRPQGARPPGAPRAPRAAGRGRAHDRQPGRGGAGGDPGELLLAPAQARRARLRPRGHRRAGAQPALARRHRGPDLGGHGRGPGDDRSRRRPDRHAARAGGAAAAGARAPPPRPSPPSGARRPRSTRRRPG